MCVFWVPGLLVAMNRLKFDYGMPLVSFGTQREIGVALKQLWDEGFDREDFFITSKLWCTRHDKVRDSLRQTLENLQLDVSEKKCCLDKQ